MSHKRGLDTMDSIPQTPIKHTQRKVNVQCPIPTNFPNPSHCHEMDSTFHEHNYSQAIINKYHRHNTQPFVIPSCSNIPVDKYDLNLPYYDVHYLKTRGQLDLLDSNDNTTETVINQSVFETLCQSSIQRLLLLGNSVLDNSSTVQHFLLDWAKSNSEDRVSKDVPILIDFKEYKVEKLNKSDLTLLEYVCKGGNVGFPIDLLSLLRPVIVILDGLDEVFEVRDLILQDIRNFISQLDSQSIRMVITSRLVGFQLDDLKGLNFQHFKVLPLSMNQIQKYIDQWCPSKQGCLQKIRLVKALSNNHSLAKFASNPSLLSMVVAVNCAPEIAHIEVDSYEECVKFLINTGNLNSSMMTSTNNQIEKFSYNDKIEFLSNLAMKIQDDSKSLCHIIDKQQMEVLISEQVEKLKFNCDSIKLSRVILKQLSQSDILSFLGGTYYSFVHHSFLEYFCAAYYKKLWINRDLEPEDLISIFRNHANDFTWNQVLIFLSGMIPSNFVEPCINMLLDLGQYSLAVNCSGQLKNCNQVKSNTLNRCRKELVKLCRYHDFAANLTVSYFSDEDILDMLSYINQSDQKN